MRKHRVVLTGGGTGGHIYPALSVHERLVDDGQIEAILYIGATGHMEEKLCEERSIDFRGLLVSGLPRKFSKRMFTWPFQTLKALVEARKILGRFDPTVVLGTGGYASAASLLAAQQMLIPTVVHEPDAHPGLVNILFSKNAHLVSLGMEGAANRLRAPNGRIVFNGNPIRSSFTSGKSKSDALTSLGLNPNLQTIVITGGSQGAQAINRTVAEIVPGLLDEMKDLQIIHQAGARNYDQIIGQLKESIVENKRYLLKPYFPDMSVVYAASDLAIGRAGAMTISELTVTGTPCIFIPYPFAAQDHQMLNAKYLESQKAAFVISESQLDSTKLSSLIREILSSTDKLDAMKAQMLKLGKPDAAKMLAEQIKSVSTRYINQTSGF